MIGAAAGATVGGILLSEVLTPLLKDLGDVAVQKVRQLVLGMQPKENTMGNPVQPQQNTMGPQDVVMEPQENAMIR